MQPAAIDPSYHVVEDSLRHRILLAAIEMLADDGWSGITMAGLGRRVGVSRQTVYNEVGSKHGLAQALVGWQLEVFLGAVQEELAGHERLSDAITAASARVLRLSEQNPVLLAAVSTAQGAQQDLLPLLTTQAEPIIAAATTLIAAAIADRAEVTESAQRQFAAAEVVVRLVLSFVTRPSGSIDEMASEVAWVGTKLLSADG